MLPLDNSVLIKKVYVNQRVLNNIVMVKDDYCDYTCDAHL